MSADLTVCARRARRSDSPGLDVDPAAATGKSSDRQVLPLEMRCEMVLAAAEWPCVGRADARSRVFELLRAGRSVLIAGPPGVGRSFLVADCAKHLHADGLEADFRTWSRWAVPPPTRKRHAPAAVTVIEDIHLLDEDAAAQLHGMCAEPVQPLLLTLCTGERVARPITALWADNLVERLDLPTLTTTQIEELLIAVLGGQVDEALTARLTRRCEGNLLYLRELVLGGVQNGTIVDDDGIWRAPHNWPLPQRLIEIVTSRLDRLAADERAALELIAFAGTVGTAEIETLMLAGMVESLERQKFVVSTVDERRLDVAVSQPLVAEVVVAETPVVRQRLLARQLAELVEGKECRRAGDLLQVARWRLAGGGGTPELLLDGARAARSAHDFPLAERLARAASREGAGFPADLLVAKLVGLQGGDAECQQALLELADRAGTEDESVAVQLAQDEHRAIWVGSLGLGGRGGGDLSVASATWRREMWARRAGTLLLTEGPMAAVVEATSLLNDPKDGVRSWAAIVLGYSLARVGRCQDALEVTSSGQASHSTLEWFAGWDRWWHAFNRTEALLQIGRLGDAHSLALANYEQALVTPSPEEQAFFGWQLCKINFERGRLTTSAHYGKVCSALFREIGRSAYVRVAQVSLALAWARAGHTAQALRLLAEVERSGQPLSAISAVDLHRARAWCAAMAGSVVDARIHIGEAIDVGASCQDLAGESAALHDLVRLGGSADACARLAKLDAASDSKLVHARHLHATAVSSGDPESLMEGSARFHALGARLTAAEAAADSAVRLRRGGHLRQAAATEQRAHQLLRDCEGAQAFGVGNLTARSVLSPGEHETAAIAATGRSNREIATHLRLSTRTVENRLQRVYDKLGVRGRDDLAGALGLAAAPSE